MNRDHGQVCPVAVAGSLDNVLRRWVQNPLKIVTPYVREGMTALDVGCGPGFFTIPLAQRVGRTGRVIAADLQQGMLDKIGRKIAGTDLAERIALHRCDKNRIGLSEEVDFVLLFYMVHEIPDQDRFFGEIARLMRPTAQALFAEPPFHVSRTAFERSLGIAQAAGLTASPGPDIFLGRTAILRKGRHLSPTGAQSP